MSNLRRIVVYDVRVVGMMSSIVLMVSLGRIEGLQWNDLGYDRAREDLGFCQLRNIGLGNSFLFVLCVEEHRTILAAHIRTLPIQLSRIVRYRKEHPKQLAIGDLGWIVNNFHRFRMAGFAGADHFVLSSIGGASAVPGSCADDALHVREDRLYAPETPAGDYRCLCRLRRGNRIVHFWRWQRNVSTIAGVASGYRCQGQEYGRQAQKKARHNNPPVFWQATERLIQLVRVPRSGKVSRDELPFCGSPRLGELEQVFPRSGIFGNRA